MSAALLELVPWKAREGLEKMVAEDNERFRLVSDTITQRVEEMDAAVLRAQQVGTCAGVRAARVHHLLPEPRPQQRCLGMLFPCMGNASKMQTGMRAECSQVLGPLSAGQGSPGPC